MSLFERRMLETYGAEILLSVIPVFSQRFGFYKTAAQLFAICAIVTLIYLSWTVHCLYDYWLFAENKVDYFVTNITVNVIMFIPAIILPGIAHFVNDGVISESLRRIYDYGFFPFNIFRNLGKALGHEIGNSTSALLFSILNLLIIIAIPFIFERKKTELKKEEDF